jgi:hypothetical protein
VRLRYGMRRSAATALTAAIEDAHASPRAAHASAVRDKSWSAPSCYSWFHVELIWADLRALSRAVMRLQA